MASDIGVEILFWYILIIDTILRPKLPRFSAKNVQGPYIFKSWQYKLIFRYLSVYYILDILS